MMEKNSKIYVAGHRGMVGSAIVRELQRQGYTNIITRTHAELDLTRQAEVEAFFQQERPEYVFLAAAKVGGIIANQSALADFMYDNMILEMNVIHAAWQNGCRKLEFLGSSCIYPRFTTDARKLFAHLCIGTYQRSIRPCQDLGLEILRILESPVRYRLYQSDAYQPIWSKR